LDGVDAVGLGLQLGDPGLVGGDVALQVLNELGALLDGQLQLGNLVGLVFVVMKQLSNRGEGKQSDC
jgi:hypothetical protein